MGSFNYLPNDYVRIKAGERISAPQQILSRARNFARTTRRDVRGQIKMHKMRTNPDLIRGKAATQFVGDAARAIKKQMDKNPDAGIKFGAHAQNFGSAANKTADAIGKRLDQLKKYERGYAKQNALVLGGAILGTAVGLQGIKSYRKWRKKAKERTQYRGYDVYPEYDYATSAQQVYNQPYYNESREELISLIIESFMQDKYLF